MECTAAPTNLISVTAHVRAYAHGKARSEFPPGFSDAPTILAWLRDCLSAVGKIVVQARGFCGRMGWIGDQT